MNDALAQKIKASTERYYRDIVGLPDWQTCTGSWRTRQHEAHIHQRQVNLAGPLDRESIPDVVSA